MHPCHFGYDISHDYTINLLGQPGEPISDPESASVAGELAGYPVVNIQKAMENGHLWLIYHVKNGIFYSYGGLPEGAIVDC